MTWRPTIAALTGLCLALTTAPGPVGAALAPRHLGTPLM